MASTLPFATSWCCSTSSCWTGACAASGSCTSPSFRISAALLSPGSWLRPWAAAGLSGSLRGGSLSLSNSGGGSLKLDLTIREDDLSGPDVVALIGQHRALMASVSPPESMHALAPVDLRASKVSGWTAWRDDTLLGCGALVELDAAHGEIKSMHTAAAFRGQGVGAAILGRIVAEARGRGIQRLSLETGSMREFAPAQSLYQRHGFTYCPPFGTYEADPNSVFMTLLLAP